MSSRFAQALPPSASNGGVLLPGIRDAVAPGDDNYYME